MPIVPRIRVEVPRIFPYLAARHDHDLPGFSDYRGMSYGWHGTDRSSTWKRWPDLDSTTRCVPVWPKPPKIVGVLVLNRDLGHVVALFNRIDDIKALDDPAKHGMHAVQVCLWAMADEKLAAAGVFSRVGHR